MAGLSSANRSEKNTSRRLVDRFTEWSLNWVPDSMVFVLALTVIVYLMALVFTDHGPVELVDDFASGFWLLLTFAMQMCLMMISGFVVADSKFVKSGIIKLVDWPKTPKRTMLMFCLVVGVVCWFHWGIGLMLSIVMGKQIAVRKRGLGIHYPFLAAVAYSTQCIMANGVSQAAPLLMATPGNFLEKTVGGLIPLTQTALSPFLMTFMVIQLFAIPLLVMYLLPKKENAVELDEALASEFAHVPPATGDVKDLRPAERWERSPVLPTLLALVMLFWVAKFFWLNGVRKLDLNMVNFTFFAMGLLLHRTPQSFISSVKQGVNTTFGVIIQFPLYAGIFGIISNSGLAGVITHWFISISTTETYALIVVIYTSMMDFFVPSGGSKFVIEAPYILSAGQHLGVPAHHVVNAYSTGAQLANNIQPFWALAYLAAFKLKFQDILPYTFLFFVLSGIMATIAFLVFPTGL
ncbi:short-chain fatty acid transporter [Sporomusa termitida]|uniref:Short-chain fatty acid transporter n=1 Tax=Sporomusa termitida TaxID=2377 RepID=A0A517DX54_9FIRM|nr:TIGR00366 family protein [Sporomusa termitida]QDR81826.1 Putative short-chain fatty acid transporter [Sporomusa termitida]